MLRGQDRLNRQQFFQTRMANWPAEDVEAHTGLERHLQSLPGHEQSLLVPAEGEAAFNRQLISRGVLHGGQSVPMPGNPNSCHGNSANCAAREPDTELWTGYASSKDGLWRNHSWVRRGGQIHETTTPRTAYFGALLTDVERENFIANNRED
jgi:hypothetical protein